MYVPQRLVASQKGNPADAEELNITAGDKYTVEESNQSPSNPRYTNCIEGDLQLYRNALKFNYSLLQRLGEGIVADSKGAKSFELTE